MEHVTEILARHRARRAESVAEIAAAETLASLTLDTYRDGAALAALRAVESADRNGNEISATELVSIMLSNMRQASGHQITSEIRDDRRVDEYAAANSYITCVDCCDRWRNLQAARIVRSLLAFSLTLSASDADMVTSTRREIIRANAECETCAGSGKETSDDRWTRVLDQYGATGAFPTAYEQWENAHRRGEADASLPYCKVANLSASLLVAATTNRVPDARFGRSDRPYLSHPDTYVVHGARFVRSLLQFAGTLRTIDAGMIGNYTIRPRNPIVTHNRWQPTLAVVMPMTSPVDHAGAIAAAILADGPAKETDHDPATCHRLHCKRCDRIRNRKVGNRSGHFSPGATDNRSELDRESEGFAIGTLARVRAVRDMDGERLAPRKARKGDRVVPSETTTNRQPAATKYGTSRKYAGSVDIAPESTLVSMLDRTRKMGGNDSFYEATEPQSWVLDKRGLMVVLADLATVTNSGPKGLAVRWEEAGTEMGLRDVREWHLQVAAEIFARNTRGLLPNDIRKEHSRSAGLQGCTEPLRDAVTAILAIPDQEAASLRDVRGMEVDYALRSWRVRFNRWAKREQYRQEVSKLIRESLHRQTREMDDRAYHRAEIGIDRTREWRMTYRAIGR